MPSVWIPWSTQTLYASKIGCQAINPSNPQVGFDSSAALNAALAQAQTSNVELIIDIPVLANQLQLYSGVTVRGLGVQGSATYPTPWPTSGIWMKAVGTTTNSCVFKNANWKSTYGAYTKGPSNITDKDITIRDLYLNGQGSNGVNTGGTQPWSNTYGFPVDLFQLWGISGLVVENIFMWDPVFLMLWMSNVEYVTTNNIQGYYPNMLLNPTTQAPVGTDVIHIVGPANWVSIRNTKGCTTDVVISLQAIDGNVAVLPQSPNLSVLYMGSITNVTIDDTHCVNTSAPFQIQGGADPNIPANVADVINVNITNTFGVARNPVAWCPTYAGSPNGNGGAIKKNITFDKWKMSYLTSSARSASGWTFGGICDNIKLRDISWRDVASSGSTAATAHQINFGSDAAIGLFEIDSFTIQEDASEQASVSPAVLVGAGTIDELVMTRCTWSRNAVTSTQFCSVTGGTVNRLVMADCQFSNINNAISVTGGTVGGITTTGLSHRGANSNPSVAIGTGVTVARMRSSGSDTAQLQAGAGTVTSKKTDATEDS
jgi:hypothetical protein